MIGSLFYIKLDYVDNSKNIIKNKLTLNLARLNHLKEFNMNFNKINSLCYGVSINTLDCVTASLNEVQAIKDAVYRNKIVVVKNQSLTPEQFVSFGKKFGTVREYYEKMYHHPSEKEIFVSSNIEENGSIQGVPKTGSFWHSDYAFMEKPFALTITYPQIVPKFNRGTYFIDMAQVYESLDHELKSMLENTKCQHSVRKYFKIRPTDVYRPLGEILKEIEEKTPTVTHPTIITHPYTREKILYISEGFTQSIKGLNNSAEVLQELLRISGQLDTSYTHPNINLLEIEQGDIIIWDNRKLVHHAKHAIITEPSKTFRITVYDEFPFSYTNNIVNRSAEEIL